MSVEKLMELVPFRKMFVDQFQKFLCYLRLDIFTERGVVPNYIPLAVSSPTLSLLRWNELKSSVVTTPLKRFFVVLSPYLQGDYRKNF